MKKIFWIIATIVLVLIVTGIIVVATSLNGIVKKGVETFGPQITKVSIKLDSVNIGLLTGSAKVNGLVVGNPEGYKAPQAISVGQAEVGVNPFSILSDKIVVRTIHINAPEITFEGGLSGNNLSTILANVNAFAKSGATSSTNAASATSKPSKKIQVDEFLITGAKVHVLITGVGAKELNLTLPDIHLTNLGTGSEGLTPADLTRAVLSAITGATVKAVAASVGDIGKGVESLGKDATKGATESVDKVKKSLDNLFGK